jgi:hypothetical protein
MTNRVVGRTVQASHAGNRFLGSLKCLQIRALYVLTSYSHWTGHPIFFFSLVLVFGSVLRFNVYGL